jgi:hypothetical protein
MGLFGNLTIYGAYSRRAAFADTDVNPPRVSIGRLELVL